MFRAHVMRAPLHASGHHVRHAMRPDITCAALRVRRLRAPPYPVRTSRTRIASVTSRDSPYYRATVSRDSPSCSRTPCRGPRVASVQRPRVARHDRVTWRTSNFDQEDADQARCTCQV